MLIGVHGKLGSGKDTVLEELQRISPKFVRHSFADKLKESASALLGIDRETIELLKRDEEFHSIVIRKQERQQVTSNPDALGLVTVPVDSMTMRTFLQRYGTESHRDLFGQSFWVDLAMGPALKDEKDKKIPVFTDCRFPNEAEAVLEAGGEVWEVIGPETDTGEHASETRLPDKMISLTIDNTVRSDDRMHLSKQLQAIAAKRIGKA